MIVLDTTVLIYAVGTEHPLRDPCRGVIEAIGAGHLSATTTVEVIQELLHVRARRRSRADATAVAGNYVDLLSPLTRPDADGLRRGFDLFAAAEGLGPFDAVLAATVLGSDHLTGLVSADRAFGGVPRLLHHDPADPAMPADLGIADG